MHAGLLVAKLVTMGLGLLVASRALSGYLRYGHRPMLFVAVGFGVVSVAAVLEGILHAVVGLSTFAAGSLQTAGLAAGMALVVYSLYCRAGPPESDGTPGSVGATGDRQ